MASAYAETETQPLILELLARRSWFKPKQLEEIEETLHKAGAGTLPEVTLIRAGYISEQEITSLYAEDLFLPVIRNNVEAGAVDKEIGGLLPEKLCTDRLICPMAVRDDELDVLFVSPEEMALVDELHLMTGLRINPMIAPLSVVQTQLDILYRADQHTKGIGEGSEGFDVTEGDGDNDNDNILNLDATPPADANGRIIRMVNQILEQALRNGASDIHLEPFEDGCKFRLRIDGVLHELPSPSKAIFIMIVSRLQDPRQDGHRREAHPPGRGHRAADRRQADRSPRQHGAHRLRREDGDADPRQGCHPHPTDRPGLRRAAVERPDRVDPCAARPDAGHRPDRQRQDHHALCLPQPAERARHEHLHGRGPGRVQVQGHEPGAGQGARWG